ncbi:hypothetical protein Mal52_48960 [Symmachiella dynata]|uniref:Uncharacterized protein n=1 Tax=Symmachiella dynata TaxID=2527995 RepID=A0A517ZVB7_9PLAN|nr:hypothetical protein [Symmachiella dynata]QDU46376.1 hypothetical protein Mal52_48960 [Symmachiella dynata]
MHPAQSSKAKPSANERPLISRSTIVILLSYQAGMLIGNGIPTTLSAMMYLAVTVGLISYLGIALVRQESVRRREANKHRKIAQRIDRRIQAHIIDPPVQSPKAPIQPKLRADADFIPVVNNWA